MSDLTPDGDESAEDFQPEPAYSAVDRPLQERISSKRRQRRSMAALLAVVGLPGLALLGTALARPGMENELEKNVELALQLKGIPNVTVLAKGQDVELTGSIGSASDRSVAVKVAEKVRGVRSADASSLSVSSTPGTTGAVRMLPLTATYTEGSVTFGGTRPSQDALDALIATTREGLGASQVSDNLSVKGSETEDVDVDAYRKLGRALSRFPALKVRNAVLTLREGSFDITGVLGDGSSREAIMALLAEVVGDANRVRDRLTVEPGGTASVTTAGTAAGTDSTVAAPGSTPETTAPAAGTASTVAAPDTTARIVSAVEAQTAVDAVLKRGRINFPTNLAALQPDGKVLIKNIAAELRGTTLKVEVAGYTDNRGDETKNQQLSQRRAEAVRNELIVQGLIEAQVTAVGRGSANPVDSNATQAGQARNRRIEFTVTG